MRRYIWALLLALPLVGVGVFVYAHADNGDAPRVEEKFICPLTGEELPCPLCCPLNQ